MNSPTDKYGMEVYPKSLFEPDECRKSEDRYYSKSNQNFFSTGKNNNNINFIDENFYSSDDIQAELNEINTKNRKNRYLDSDSLPIGENDLR